jgi:hypothetical protein
LFGGKNPSKNHKKEVSTMKGKVLTLVAVIVLVCLMGYTHMVAGKGTAKREPGPTVVIGTPMVEMSKNARVVIMGTGFDPGQKVRIFFTTTDGVRADVGYALDGKPVANDIGAWVVTWKCGRLIQRKLVTEGAYTITVTEPDSTFLAHAPVTFYAKEKPKK